MNMQDKLQKKTIELLTEAFTSIDSKYLDNYIKDNINRPLSNSALRIYNAINFNIDEKDKRVLALSIANRFAGNTSTIPPFILSALGQEKLNGKYPKVGTIKWFIENPQAIQLYYDKYKGTNKLPYTDNIKDSVNNIKDSANNDAKQLYKSSKLVKNIYNFNSNDKFNLDIMVDYITNTTLPIIVQYGAFNKEYNIINKDAVIKSLNFYKDTCDIEERDNCIFITFYIDADLQ